MRFNRVVKRSGSHDGERHVPAACDEYDQVRGVGPDGATCDQLLLVRCAASSEATCACGAAVR